MVMIVLDIKTTGEDTRKDSITRLEAFDFSGNQEPFLAECSERPSKDELTDFVKDFLGWTDGCPNITLADYNPSISREFLARALQECQLKSPFGHRAVDLHTLAYVSHIKSGKQMPIRESLSNIDMNYILGYIGLPKTEQGLKAKAEAFSRLIYKKPLFPEFKKAQLPPHFFYPQNETIEVERIVVCDVETTGLDPRRNSICDIGAIELIRNQTFESICQIRPDAEITKEAMEVNGYTEAQLRDSRKPSLEKAIRDFHYWLGNKGVLVGENPSFDQGFLMEAMRVYGLDYPLNERTLDIHTLSYIDHLRRAEQGENIQVPLNKRRTDINLDYTLRYVGLPAEPKPHRGLMGARLEAEAFSRLVFNKPFFEEFKGYLMKNLHKEDRRR